MPKVAAYGAKLAASAGRARGHHAADLPLPHVHDLGRKPLHSRPRRQHLDHPVAARLGGVTTLLEEALAEQLRPAFDELPPQPLSNHERELRAQLCEFVHRSYRQRLLISTAGAFSARLEGDEFLVNPHRRDRLELGPEKVVRAKGHACEEQAKPSRAALLHAHIYEKHPEVGAVILAQPRHASAYCMSTAELSTRTIPESYLVLLDAPKVPFACIVKEAQKLADLVDLKTCPVLLIQNEGALVVGRDLLDAFDRLEVLEATAEALQRSHPLGPLVPMPDEALQELRQTFGME